jgi:hypothetical protein
MNPIHTYDPALPDFQAHEAAPHPHEVRRSAVPGPQQRAAAGRAVAPSVLLSRLASGEQYGKCQQKIA